MSNIKELMINVVEISKKILGRLLTMGYEKSGSSNSEQLIFPNKIQAKVDKRRVSEQELRLLFIEEFKAIKSKLFYSIETPTIGKYKFGKSYEDIRVDENGQSALLDMCIFERNIDKYERILNIEFKHQNAPIKNIGKDILKLINEKGNGAFIHLLNNTDRGTLCNNNKTGVLNKIYKSFIDFEGSWNNETKTIQLIIISLKQETLIHHTITNTDLNNLKEIFFEDCGNIEEIVGNGWNVEIIKT